MRISFLLLLACAAAALFITGCGNGLADLQGTVRIDGQSAPEGLSLQFTPVAEGGSPSYANTDANGHYQASFTFKETGIQPGEHQVRLVPGAVKTPMPTIGADGRPEEAPPANPVSKLPKEYYEEIQKIEVKPGSNSIDIELQTTN